LIESGRTLFSLSGFAILLSLSLYDQLLVFNFARWKAQAGKSLSSRIVACFGGGGMVVHKSDMTNHQSEEDTFKFRLAQ
jgi:hypothetical protein